MSKKSKLIVSRDAKALVKFMKPAPRTKTKYYMEWWALGDLPTAISVGCFSSAYIKSFVKMFAKLKNINGTKKYNVLFLQRTHDRKVLWDRR